MKPSKDLTIDDKAKLRRQNQKYRDIAKYVGDWGGDVDKAKLVKNIHKNLMGVDSLGRMRPYEDLAFFLLVANQYHLNPLKNEIYATYQKVQKGKQWVEKIVPIPSIHGLRKLARQSKNPSYNYTGKAECEIDGDGDIISATVPVYGHFENSTEIVKVGEYTAYMEEFVKTKTDNDGNTYRSGNWKTMPRVMLVKCAEANAIRSSFDIGGIYIEEEIDHVGDMGEIITIGEPEETDAAYE